jgi:hypothetical protein
MVIHSGVLITQKFRFFLIGWRLFTLRWSMKARCLTRS